MTPSEERAAARALIVPLAWPTIMLAAGLLALHAGLAGAALAGGVPLWSATLPLGLSAYAHYTLVHESVHGNVARAHPWVHEALGWWGGLVLGLTWPVLRRTHQQHHSHTNASGDPDAYVHGSLPRVLALSVLLTAKTLLPWALLERVTPKDHPWLSYLHATRWMTPGERRAHRIVQGLTVLVVWGLIAAGHAGPVLALYIVPGAIGRTLLIVLFQWWPHRPFAGTSRYDATRYGYLGSEPLWLSQNLHLMHHLWPAVPWYRYRRLERALAPLLAERGAVRRDWRRAVPRPANEGAA